MLTQVRPLLYISHENDSQWRWYSAETLKYQWTITLTFFYCLLQRVAELKLKYGTVLDLKLFEACDKLFRPLSWRLVQKVAGH